MSNSNFIDKIGTKLLRSDDVKTARCKKVASIKQADVTKVTNWVEQNWSNYTQDELTQLAQTQHGVSEEQAEGIYQLVADKIKTRGLSVQTPEIGHLAFMELTAGMNVFFLSKSAGSDEIGIMNGEVYKMEGEDKALLRVSGTPKLLEVEVDHLFKTPEEVYSRFPSLSPKHNNIQHANKTNLLDTSLSRRAFWDMSKIDETLTSKNVYQKAVAYTREYFSDFEIPAKFDVSFNTIRKASYVDNKLDSGDVTVEIQLRTISGVKLKASTIIPIRDGKFLEPSTLEVNGRNRIISQSTFDEIIADGTFFRKLRRNPESIYTSEMNKYLEESEVPSVSFGVYGKE